MLTDKEGLDLLLSMNTHRCNSCGIIFLNFKGMNQHLTETGHSSYTIIKTNNKTINRLNHYHNHPNDKELTPFENKLMSKFSKMKHKLRINNIHNAINIILLKTQIKQDTRIMEMFKWMFPREYNEVYNTIVAKYGQTKKKEVRREEIIKDMNLKKVNISKLIK